MANFSFKKAASYIAFGMLWVFSISTCAAQTLSLGLVHDPEIMVAPAQTSNIVDIKAVDAPAFHAVNGKSGMGAEERYGQGIIIDSVGIIVTNRHIIGNAIQIYVALPGGKVYVAKLLRNSEEDLSFIKIDAPFPLRAISLADSSGVRTGINVIAVANAGLNLQRMHDGQVIKVYKEMTTDSVEFLEMNITLKPGDSGGPILNKDGSLLGMIMAKQISDPSKSYAIASNRILQEYFKYRNSVLN